MAAMQHFHTEGRRKRWKPALDPLMQEMEVDPLVQAMRRRAAEEAVVKQQQRLINELSRNRSLPSLRALPDLAVPVASSPGRRGNRSNPLSPSLQSSAGTPGSPIASEATLLSNSLQGRELDKLKLRPKAWEIADGVCRVIRTDDILRTAERSANNRRMAGPSLRRALVLDDSIEPDEFHRFFMLPPRRSQTSESDTEEDPRQRGRNSSQTNGTNVRWADEVRSTAGSEPHRSPMDSGGLQGAIAAWDDWLSRHLMVPAPSAAYGSP
mmetsp:Transcript_17888/g.39261  ORF Transcript_17888/g.39261 Transcript_17888/m.39261 type:complete len:267 (+) Transcript_17888:66-866(+)